MRLSPKIKSAVDRLDYDINYSRWLNVGDSLLNANVTCEDGLTIDSVGIGSPVVKIWVSGGETGKSYDITITVTTTQGRTLTSSFNMRITEN